MTQISSGQREIRLSRLGPPNPLPIFKWQQPIPQEQDIVSDKLSSEELENRFVWGRSSILPYLVQDNYDRSQQPGTLPCIYIENEFLKLTLYPGLGGRLTSIYDKQSKRELLFDNPVLQPANLGALNAWFSGGIEWNGLTPGHSLFTCSPVFVATLKTERGPLLRIYEFDRIREAIWQVDLYLPKDESRLWAHVKIVNPNPHAISCYWWTNVTMSMKNETRVFSPADYCIEHVLPDNHLEPFAFPDAHGFDGSYPARHHRSSSVFFRKQNLARPWIAAVHKDGQGLLHTSTKEMYARKMFAWNNKPGGKRWMSFLSLPDCGDYVELQAGLAPTQNQVIKLAANGVIEWTECLAPLDIEAKLAHAPDYQQSCANVESILLHQVPDDALDNNDHWLKQQAERSPDEILQQGSAWGSLYEKMTGRTISPGLVFETNCTVERPFLEILESGVFSEQTLQQPPQSWAVSDRWISVLEKSQAQQNTWLHDLLLGVARLDRGESEQARRLFESSVQLKDSYLANRHLALVAQQAGDIEKAKNLYFKAWEKSENSVNLAVEICKFLQQENLLGDLDTFIKQLPESARRNERVQLTLAHICLNDGRLDQLREILRGEFCTIRENETLLTDLWFELHIKEAEIRKGSSLTEAQRIEVMQQSPPPREIDFRTF